MAHGFAEGETWLGLRACDGNIQNTVTHIMKRQEEKKENARKRKEERHKKKLAKHLGKTVNGNNVNVDKYEMLLSMGYGNGASGEALRQASNDLNLALEVTAMGFEPEMSRRAFVKYNADVQKAIDELVNCGGSLPPPILCNQSPSSSAGSSSNTPSEVNSDKKVKEEKEAIDRLVSDLPDDEEDYLDISLEEEKHFLQEYKALMLSLIL